MKHNNIVSIIIPCYNNGRYLVKMIECFRRQTSSNWELIIVDDGSTDDTPNVVKDAIKDLTNASIYQRNRMPKGSVVCRNIGFDYAKGKYICHLDADDLVSETFVEHRVAFMEAHPEIDYASFPAKVFIEERELPTIETKGRTWGVPIGDKSLLYYFLSNNYPFSVWNNIYKRDAIKDLPWDENVLMSTDFSFIVPCILKGLKHSFSDLHEVDYYYRHDVKNKNAMTYNPVSPDKCRSYIYLLAKTQESLKEYGLFEEYNEVFFNFFLNHFRNLVLRKSKDALPEFLKLCGKYYSSWKVFRMKLLAKISLLFNYRKFTTVTYYMIGFVLFGKRDYYEALKILIFRF